MDVDEFRRLPVLGILRGADLEIIDDLVEAVIGAGLRSLEITMNTAGAPQLIQRTAALAGNRLAVGAGTVLTLADLAAACDAGATFAVMPTTLPDVVAECVRRAIPAFPGALTPQEIHTAWRAGAAMVKVFPARAFGPWYFKEIAGPFRDIPLLACGGVDPTNLADYFDCGAAAVAFGGGVFRPEWLAARDFDRIAAAAAAMVAAYRNWATPGRAPTP